MIFVFGSNLAGRHGKGAALFAKQNHGAIQGIGIGRQGNSYAIPTKDENLETFTLRTIQLHVAVFLDYAALHHMEKFQVTPIGTGLAGYSHAEISPMFKDAPYNCVLPEEWK